MDLSDLTKISNEDLKELCDKFLELKRFKLAEGIKKELDRREKVEQIILQIL